MMSDDQEIKIPPPVVFSPDYKSPKIVPKLNELDDHPTFRIRGALSPIKCLLECLDEGVDTPEGLVHTCWQMMKRIDGELNNLDPK